MTSPSFAKCAEKTAFVVGYTGEVGKEVVRELLEKKVFKKLFLIGRRSVDDPLYSNTEQRVVDFDKLENHKDAFQGCEYGFCCLGTTKKAAGTAGFIKIDHDYVVNSAKIANEAGCKRFGVVTAQNANKDSWFLYPKTKGLAELHISEIPFEKITIARPSFIKTRRSENTLYGRCVHAALKPIALIRPTYATIPVEKVAKAMIFSMCADTTDQRVEILNNDQLHKMSDTCYDPLFHSGI